MEAAIKGADVLVVAPTGMERGESQSTYYRFIDHHSECNRSQSLLSGSEQSQMITV